MASNRANAGRENVKGSGKPKSVSPSPARAQPPRLVSKQKGDAHIVDFDSVDKAQATRRLMQALGTQNPDFTHVLLTQLSNLSVKQGEIDVHALNFCLSVITDLEPRDQVEAMLAAQMAAVHTATMTFANRLNHVETVEQQDSAEKAFNKLTRSFTNQMEALRKYRNGGEQKVTVQHVNVNEGGQAVVGNINQKKAVT